MRYLIILENAEAVNPVIYFQEDDEFYTARNTILQRGYAGLGEDTGTMVASSSDGTVTDLGTLVIIDDNDEDSMGTMKRE